MIKYCLQYISGEEMADQANAEGDATAFRARLGTRLVLWSTVALVILAITVMVGASISSYQKQNAEDVYRAAQLLLSSLLPLFATWVGTVLAFYYTKENFQAATQGTLDIVKTVSQRLASTRVAQAMTNRSVIVSETVPPTGLKDLPLATVAAAFEKTAGSGGRIGRLLLFNAAGAVVAVLHRSTWVEMLNLGLQDKPPVDVKTDKLDKLIGKSNPSRVGTTYEDYISKTVAFIGAEATLADAKAAMERVPGCQDVIVTQSGAPTEPVLGWVSNADISRHSQV